MLRTKCIKDPIEVDDGLRVSVMSRHTLNDGATPDPEIASGSFDEWRVALAPLPRLVGAYYREQISWDRFEQQYLKQLGFPEIRESVFDLAQTALTGDVTIMCVEAEPEYCHRRLLALRAQILVPELVVSIH